MAENNFITFQVSDKTPEILFAFSASSNKDQIKRLRQYSENNCAEIFQMSNFPQHLHFSESGFVRTVITAWNRHYNLIIRPDDVWLAIMTQFSFYINKNAEEFCGKFVDFKDKKELTVCLGESLRNARYDILLKLLSTEIDRNLVDPDLKQWILPKFTTTTDNDRLTTGAVFLATMKKCFNYKYGLCCGIPSITLQGTVDDWTSVLERLEKLKDYKLETWYDMLEPILQQFVKARDGNVDADFWKNIVHSEGGGIGPNYVSGWITAFCVFDGNGSWNEAVSESPFRSPSGAASKQWLRIETDNIPTGIVEVDVKIDDNGVEYKSVMFAGHLATEVKETGDTVQPTLGWVIALKSEIECDKVKLKNLVRRWLEKIR